MPRTANKRHTPQPPEEQTVTPKVVVALHSLDLPTYSISFPAGDANVAGAHLLKLEEKLYKRKYKIIKPLVAYLYNNMLFFGLERL